MVKLKNIEKRRELQQDVYKQYRHLTEEERRAMRMARAAIRGYKKGMKDVLQLIADGKSIDDIKAFIIGIRHYNEWMKKYGMENLMVKES